jgi:tetratricopeptide (TPR) repeat protein
VSNDADMAATPAGTRDLPDRDAAQRLLAPRYEVVDTLGHGASAAVFEVRDCRAGATRRAAKLTDVERAPDPDALRESLRREFLLASRFDHPNLVRCCEFDLPPDGSIAVTTMEFVEGAPFSPELLGRDPRLACRLVIELLRGLQFLHECDFVHADVKPSNVLCRVEGGAVRAKLLDYHLTFDPRLARRNGPRGTLRYMAPEAIAGEQVDGRADLYSVGVLMFEALTGRTLFEGSVGDLVTQHVTAAVGGLEETGDLAGVVARLLAKRPAGRYVSAAEAIQAIADAARLEEAPETRETLLARVHSAPLIGRGAILEEARRAFIRIEAGEPGPPVWLLRGPPGSGKSRLLAELRALAQARGWCAAEAAAGSGPEPLSPPGRRLLLTIEDAQSDSEAVDAAVRRLTADAPDHGGVLCIADARGARPRCTEAGASWVIDVPDLSAGERTEAVARMLPAAVETGLVDRLAAACGGLPGVVAATVEHLVSTGRLLAGPGGRLSAAGPLFESAPEFLRGTWEAALAAAPGSVCSLARVLGVAGAGLPASLCAVAAGMPEADLEPLLGNGDARVLLERCALDEGPGWRLRHEAIAGLLAGESAERGLADAHLRLAQAIGEWEPGRERIWRARRARHLLLGGERDGGVAESLRVAAELDRWDVRPDYLETLRLAAAGAEGAERLTLMEAAADCSAARGAFADALAELNAALDAGGLGPTDRLRLMGKAATALVETGRHGEASELLDQCLRALAGVGAGGKERARAQLQLARCELAASDFDKAEALLSEAARAGRQAGDAATVGVALTDLGAVARGRHDLNEARERLVEAEQVLRGAGDRVATVRALGLRGYLEMTAGRRDAAERDLRESLRLLREAGCAAYGAHMLMGLGSLMQTSGRWTAAASQYEEALRLAERGSAGITRMAILVNLSQVRAALGWLEAAMDDAHSALELATEGRSRAAALSRLGRVQCALGLFDRAHESFVSNVQAAEEAGYAPLIETGERMAAVVEMIRGDLSASRIRLGRALMICRRKLGPTREAICRVRLIELALAEGDAEAALREANQACETAEAEGDEQTRVRTWLGRGKARLFAGMPDAAIEDLHKADKVLRRTGVWDDQVETQYELGRSYAAANRPRFAALYLNNALNTVEHVAGRLRKQENYHAFLAAPLPAGIFRAIRQLRETADAG